MTKKVRHEDRKREARSAAVGTNRVFTFDTLPAKGITFHPNHVRRLVRRGKFPKPIYLSERRPAWTEQALDAWIGEREAKRDQADGKR